MWGGGGGGALPDFFFFSFYPCSADHERDWPPCKVVIFGLTTNDRYAECEKHNNNNNNIQEKMVMVQKYSGKATYPKKPKKEETKTKKDTARQLLGNCLWLSERMHIKGRTTIERRAALQRKQKRRQRNKTKQT